MSADQGGRRRRRPREQGRPSARNPNYRHLRHRFPPVPEFPEDRIRAIHDAALRVLEELGVKVLLPEARSLFAAAGARIRDDDMVHIGRDMVEATLASAPKSIALRGGSPARDLTLELGSLVVQPGAGAPHATDRERGRRPGRLSDFVDSVVLTQAFDVFHLVGGAIEPQDVPTHIRHYRTTAAQLTLSDKVPFFYSRGTPQTEDCFAMLRLARGLDEASFRATPACYTIINTNSPRQIDIPMAQGLIDFARAGQVAIVTPFCLSGAMAPITVAGALMLSHAEALAAICLNQLARAGAPVCYGAFASNVDMKSGAPAFGTPEHVRANLVSGQLARLVGLPWRSAAGCAANTNDAQAAHETVMSAWGAILAGCTVLVHGAGWIEGGLTVSYEKIITDLEALQTFAELCHPAASDDGAIGFEAVAEVQPGGHFFAAGHTMERYREAFYEPLVADWSNFGTWTERGALTADARATSIWKRILAEAEPPATVDPGLGEALEAFAANRIAAGGAPPVS